MASTPADDAAAMDPGEAGPPTAPPSPDDPEELLSAADQRADLLAATVAHAVDRDSRYRGAPSPPRAPTPWWTWGASLTLLLLAGLAALAPPRWVAGPPLPSVSPQELERGVHATLVLQAAAVEAYRAREGTLPPTLDESGVTFPEIRYVRSNSRVFQLVATGPDGRPVVWDPADPPLPGRELARRWSRGSEVP